MRLRRASLKRDETIGPVKVTYEFVNETDDWMVLRSMRPTDGEVSTDLPDHLGRWLEAFQWRFAQETEALLTGKARELGLRRLRILQLIPAAGVRQTDLAARALISKQSLGPRIDSLEQQGLVERAVDPSDARAWIVTLSGSGRRVAASLDRALATVERGLASEVGQDDAAAFMRVLRRYGSGEIEDEFIRPVDRTG